MQFSYFYMLLCFIPFIKLCILFYSPDFKQEISGRTQHNCMIDYVGYLMSKVTPCTNKIDMMILSAFAL